MESFMKNNLVQVEEIFAEVGFPCPSRRNPSDHFFRCINLCFDTIRNTSMGSNHKNTHVCN